MPNYLLDPCIETELWEIWSYIAHDNPDAATSVVEAAYTTFQALAENPRLGIARKFRHPSLREVRSIQVAGYPNYLIFYRPVYDTVQVLHIYHGARDLEVLFENT